MQLARTETIVPVPANADVAGHLHHAVAGDARPARLSPDRTSTSCAVMTERWLCVGFQLDMVPQGSREKGASTPLPPVVFKELDMVPQAGCVLFCFSLLIPVWHSSLLQDLGAVQHSQAKRQTRQLL